MISGTAAPCSILDVTFFVAGTSVPATVSGFGAVFTDVDITGNARIVAYGQDGSLLSPGFMAPTASGGGLSFVGVSYNAGERIAHVQIVSGTTRLASGNVDGGGTDVVAMDDFIYGEPRSMIGRTSDFDGDGRTDLAVFRPSNGGWFVFNSGSGTTVAVPFGVSGDVPVEGDYDGDGRTDLAVFRPSNGAWYIRRSSDGVVTVANWGVATDIPVPGDYDNDRKTDMAVWRPGNGVFYVLKSSTGLSSSTPWGTNGDVPVAKKSP